MEIELFLTYSLYTKMKRKNVVKFEIINKKKFLQFFVPLVVIMHYYF